jgi:hypothetical protein
MSVTAAGARIRRPGVRHRTSARRKSHGGENRPVVDAVTQQQGWATPAPHTPPGPTRRTSWSRDIARSVGPKSPQVAPPRCRYVFYAPRVQRPWGGFSCLAPWPAVLCLLLRPGALSSTTAYTPGAPLSGIRMKR